MFTFKVRSQSTIGHHRLTIFARDLPTETWANCGSLMMTAYEADAFKAAFKYEEWEDADRNQ